jgi:hypothetical protein
MAELDGIMGKMSQASTVQCWTEHSRFFLKHRLLGTICLWIPQGLLYCLPESEAQCLMATRGKGMEEVHEGSNLPLAKGMPHSKVG